MDPRAPELAVVSTLRQPVQRWLADRAKDTLTVIAIVASLIFLGSVPSIQQAVSAAGLTTALALVSVAVGSIAAIGAGFVGSLTDSRRGVWLCLTLATYSLLVIPAATLNSTVTWEHAATGNIRLLTHAMFVVLIYVTALDLKRPNLRNSALLLTGALLLIATAALLGLHYPDTSNTISATASAPTVIAAVWLITTTPMLIVSYQLRSQADYHIALACAILPLAYHFRAPDGSPAAPLNFTFLTLRLFSLILMMLATASLARQSLHTTHHTNQRQQEALHTATAHIQRLAERDHELRNGLAGLANAATLLSNHPEKSATLQKAVASEITRLNTLLLATDSLDTLGTPTSYHVNTVLTEQVALHAATGLDIRLDADHDIYVTGRENTLAQAISNILANCARHAPGSPVRIQTNIINNTLKIRITDFGPGLPPPREHNIFTLNTPTTHPHTHGIGLHISHRLLTTEGAHIHIKPRQTNQPTGCTVFIELPIDTHNQPGTPEPPEVMPLRGVS
jgi:two-component system OmpR family sensor kinase